MGYLIDLFAGAGGVSCGLKLAGFRPIWANEYIPVYAETYRFNHSETEVVVDDIKNIDPKKIMKSLGLKKVN